MPADAQWQLRAEIVNSFTASRRGDRVAAFDGETIIATAGYHRVAGTRWEWGIEVPYVRHRGGFTDRMIDGFHDLFGLPENGRPKVPRHQLNYWYTAEDGDAFRVDDETGDIGDVRLLVGRRFPMSPGRALALRGQVKAPTGDYQELSGSGETDAAAWLEYADAEILSAVGVELSLMVAMTYLGRSRLAPDDQERVAFSGHLGLQYRLSDRVTLLGQLDGHSRLFSMGIDEVGGEALLGTLGGRLRLGERLALDLGVVEDLTSRSAPDVTFHFALTGQL